MTKQEIFKIISESAKSLQTNQNGFFSVAQLGGALVRENFDCSKNGYKRLLDLLNDFKDEIEISITEVPSKLPYAKIKNSELSATSLQAIQTVKRVRNLDLDGWGIIFDSNTKLNKLKEIALYEDWHYGNIDDGSNPILENYLLYTFKRLKLEGGKILMTKEHAVFDTV